MTVPDLLRSAVAPDEERAQERAWEVVRSVYAERQVVPARRRRLRWRLIPIPVAAAVATVVALSPAGATVHRWIDQTLGLRNARPGVFSLPAPGRLLVSGPTGAWTVSADGVKRWLGPFADASWSPRGRYVTLAGRGQLIAADPHGVLAWSVSRPAVRFPRWFAPNGWRIAYLSGHALRVIAGDSTGDQELAPKVAPVAPAWRPGHRYELAYVTAGGAVMVRDSDTGILLWSLRLAARPRLLQWSADGSRLLVLSSHAARVLSGSGVQIAAVPVVAGAVDGALSPDGSSLALLSGGQVSVTTLPPGPRWTRSVFAGEGLRQLAWSPDSHWLLVTWPAADQWVFVHASGAPRDLADSRIAEQFGGAIGAFPTLDGWCCTTIGSAG